MEESLENVIHRRGTFDIGNASTLGPTLQRILPSSSSLDVTNNELPLEIMLSVEKYIFQKDAVREVLIALQGRKNILFEWIDNRRAAQGHHALSIFPSPLSILFRRPCANHLPRYNISGISHLQSLDKARMHVSKGPERGGVGSHESRKLLRTLRLILKSSHLERWCANREELMIKALAGALSSRDDGLVVSILNTEQALRDSFEESFDVLLSVAVKLASDEAPSNWDLPNCSGSISHLPFWNMLLHPY
ncbi:hypothetical protein VNI00_016453 [Paramarasmius palmivorus]|uniref:Uncharacterized protein n=1 Tax=Paramarasmius palmivorus TaxID=297713 RepID=A0AAW0BGN4_9AGAR